MISIEKVANKSNSQLYDHLNDELVGLHALSIGLSFRFDMLYSSMVKKRILLKSSTLWANKWGNGGIIQKSILSEKPSEVYFQYTSQKELPSS